MYLKAANYVLYLIPKSRLKYNGSIYNGLETHSAFFCLFFEKNLDFLKLIYPVFSI